MLALLSSIILLQGCISRKEVVAEIWLQSGLPEDLCIREPELQKYGIYRKLDSGKYEFISYCTEIQDDKGQKFPATQGYLSVKTEKFYSILDQLLPENK